MKVCPTCKARAFDDADICYGCMYRFGSEPTREVQPQSVVAQAVENPSAVTRATEDVSRVIEMPRSEMSPQSAKATPTEKIDMNAVAIPVHAETPIPFVIQIQVLVDSDGGVEVASADRPRRARSSAKRVQGAPLHAASSRQIASANQVPL